MFSIQYVSDANYEMQYKLFDIIINIISRLNFTYLTMYFQNTWPYWDFLYRLMRTEWMSAKLVSQRALDWWKDSKSKISVCLILFNITTYFENYVCIS